MSDVAPHRKGAGAEAGHLAKCPPPDGKQIGVGGEFVFEKRAEGGGDELREMADPGTEDVVAFGVHVKDMSTEASNPGSPGLRRRRIALGRSGRSEQPHGAVEKSSIGVRGAADFLACHGVAREKSRLAGAVEFATGMDTNRAL